MCSLSQYLSTLTKMSIVECSCIYRQVGKGLNDLNVEHFKKVIKYCYQVFGLNSLHNF